MTKRYVDPETCVAWREQYADGGDFSAIADRAAWTYDTVREHVRGECAHDADGRTYVSGATCAAWCTDERPVVSIADESEWNYRTVYRHIRGRCSHTHHVDPTPSDRTTDADTVLACPECDATAVHTTGEDLRARETPDHEFLCRDCTATFDEPAERAKHTSAGPRRGLAGDLAAADPAEVFGDE